MQPINLSVARIAFCFTYKLYLYCATYFKQQKNWDEHRIVLLYTTWQFLGPNPYLCYDYELYCLAEASETLVWTVFGEVEIFSASMWDHPQSSQSVRSAKVPRRRGIRMNQASLAILTPYQAAGVHMVLDRRNIWGILLSCGCLKECLLWENESGHYIRAH